MTPVFVTGGSGYIGRRLIKKLVARGYEVTALVRKGSQDKLPPGVRAIIADPFDSTTFKDWIPAGAVYVQLLGAKNPSPRKSERFQQIDLPSVKTSADAAAAAGVSHFVYVSVAMTESKMMKDFQDARRQGEAFLQTKGFPCTFIRPWYVLGPGHWWPALLLPFYGVAQLLPSLKTKARAFRLVTLGQMIQALVSAVERPPQRIRIVEIDQIKRPVF